MNRNTICVVFFFLIISVLSAFVLIRSNTADDEMIKRELAKPYTPSVVVGKYTVLFKSPATAAVLNSTKDLADILNTNGVQRVSWIERDDGKYFLCEKENTRSLAFTRTEIKSKKD